MKVSWILGVIGVPIVYWVYSSPAQAQPLLSQLSDGHHLLCEMPRRSPPDGFPSSPLLGYSHCFAILKTGTKISGLYFIPHSDFSLCFRGSITPGSTLVSGRGSSFEFGLRERPNSGYDPSSFQGDQISGRGTQAIQINQTQFGYEAIFVYDVLEIDLSRFAPVPWPSPDQGYKIDSSTFLELPECQAIHQNTASSQPNPGNRPRLW